MGTPALEELLSHVYGSAVDNTGWASFCDAFSRYSGAKILLFGHDLDTNEGLGLLGGGFDPAELHRYEADFADKNPWMHMNVAMPVGYVGVSDQALSQHDLFKTEFYNGWLRQQENIVGGSAMICHRSAKKFVAIAAACRAPGYDNKVVEARALLQALSPHLTRAIAFGKAFREARAPAAQFVDAVEHGMILLMRSGRVGHVNGPASRFLENTDAMFVGHDRKLKIKDDALQGFFRRTCAAIATMDFSLLPAPVQLASGLESPVVLHAHLLPEEVETRFPSSVWADPAACAIVIAGAHRLGGKSAHDLAKGLGATEAEARLAVALIEGEALYDYADRRGLSRHTVRNQMRALLAKSGARTQADFVRTMLHLSSPFRSYER